MHFNRYKTQYAIHSKEPGWRQLRKASESPTVFLRCITDLIRRGKCTGPPHLESHLAAESKWWEAERPYYNVWPCMLEMLRDAAVDIPFKFLTLPHPTIAVCLPVGERISSILFTVCNVDELWYQHSTAVIVFALHVEVNDPAGEVVCYRMGFVNGDDLFARVLAPQGVPTRSGRVLTDEEENNILIEASHICCGVAVLANDPQFLEPIVLNKDLFKYGDADEATRQYLEDRAARNKGRGFEVGKQLEEEVKKERGEVGSHFRRPHMALFWTGKDREIPKLKLRRGAIVNPRKLTEVPTGYLSREEVAGDA